MMPGLLGTLTLEGHPGPRESEAAWSHDDPLIPGTSGSAAPGWALPLLHTDCACLD